MLVRRTAILSLALAAAAFQASAQEQTFESDGRLFSAGTIDYFLLSREPYASEDSSGYQGDVRAVRKYDGGGYQIFLKHYVARCAAPFDNNIQIVWSQLGTDDQLSVPIRAPNKLPPSDVKESYNLYWAACFEKYQKFR
jgi:hypothetical protein